MIGIGERGRVPRIWAGRQDGRRALSRDGHLEGDLAVWIASAFTGAVALLAVIQMRVGPEVASPPSPSMPFEHNILSSGFNRLGGRAHAFVELAAWLQGHIHRLARGASRWSAEAWTGRAARRFISSADCTSVIAGKVYHPTLCQCR